MEAQSFIQYFKNRKKVLFISYCRFFEKHAFVQQSLARKLTEQGVDVLWLDGAGWRPYRPTLYWQSPHLKVKQLFELPGRRISFINAISLQSQGRRINRWLKKNPEAVVWVQGGIEEELAEWLPYIDVFSVFDDPRRNSPTGILANKAKLILCQNSFAAELFQKHHPEKTQLAFPPVEISREEVTGEVILPAFLPEKKMGYLGSFFSYDFDFVMFESFIKALPDWGFVLMGRTDKAGEEKIQEFKKYKNFSRLPWVPANGWARTKPLFKLISG